MCGGSLEVLPCSHVGHLYRTSIYSFNGDKEKTKARNNNRLIEVWVDEFKEFYHGYFPSKVNKRLSKTYGVFNTKDQLFV